MASITQEEWRSAVGVQALIENLKGRWAVESLFVLHGGDPEPRRLGEVLDALNKRGVKGPVWPNTLRSTLDRLCAAGLVDRHQEDRRIGPGSDEQRPAHAYGMSALGRELVDMLNPLGLWTHEQLAQPLADDEIVVPRQRGAAQLESQRPARPG